MGTRLIIVGGGDFAREIAWGASEVPREGRAWDELGGFLDDRPEHSAALMREAGAGLPVLGAIATYQPRPDDVFICGIAAPQTKREVCVGIRSRGGRFVNVIHPTAAVAPTARLGTGIFIWRNSLVSVGARLGDFVSIHYASSVGHDSELGDGCTFSSHCEVMGHTRLDRGVFLGSHASVLPNARLGAFARVGAGSVVLRRVRPGETVFGVPGRPVSTA